jgi:hypothetical protein
VHIPSNCDRCKGKMADVALSKFNGDILCGKCKETESKHPGYAVAEEVNKFVNRSNRGFSGIGRPSDL